MQSPEPTWWYVSLDAISARPTAVRVLGTVHAPAGTAWLALVMNKGIFSTTKLLLVPSVIKGVDQPHPSQGLIPVRAYDGSRLVAAEVLQPEFLDSAQVLDIGGVASTRHEAEAWSSR
jgi:hypothetical protein